MKCKITLQERLKDLRFAHKLNLSVNYRKLCVLSIMV